MKRKKIVKAKPVLPRVKALEGRAESSEREIGTTRTELWRTQRDVRFLGNEVRRHDEVIEDQSRRIESLEERQWMNENPY